LWDELIYYRIDLRLFSLTLCIGVIEANFFSDHLLN